MIRRLARTVLPGVVLAATHATAVAQTAADSVEVRARLEAYATTWDTHDPAVLGVFFTDDADMVMGNGPRIEGREAIETWWGRYFARQEPSRRLTLDLRSLRLVAPGVGIVDVATTTGGRDAEGGALQARRARGTWVIVRPDETWVIAAIRGFPTVRDSVVLGTFVESAGAEDPEVPDDPTGVRAFVDTYEDALNARDPSALTALYTDDGDILVRNLPAVRGRPAIEAWWREYFRDRAYWADPEFRVEFTVERVRTVTPDAAVVDLVAGAERDVEERPRPTRETRATWVVVRREGEWRVAALRVLPSVHDRIIREHERASLSLREFLHNSGEAVSAGDAEALVRRFTPDGVLLWPGTPAIEGREALRAWFEARFAAVDVEIENETLEIEVAGEWAFERGRSVATVRPRDGGAVQTVHGKYLNVLRRQADGTWRVARRIRNADHPVCP